MLGAEVKVNSEFKYTDRGSDEHLRRVVWAPIPYYRPAQQMSF